MVTAVPPTLSYCVVNTNGREDLLACLAAIERTHPEGVEAEILVLDNASEDGSAAAVRALGREIRLIELELNEALPGDRDVVGTGGGLVNSPAWTQIMADALGRPIALS